MNRTLRVALVSLLAVVLLVLPFRSYLDGSVLLFEDANLPWAPDLVTALLDSYRHAWLPAFSGGLPSILHHESTAYALPHALLSLVFGIGRASVLIYPLALGLTGAGAFVAARTFGRSVAAAGVASAVAILNPWIWDQILAGHVGVIDGIAGCPWVLAGFGLSRRRPILGMLAASTALAVVLLFDPRIAFLAIGALVASVAATAIASLRASGPRAGLAALLPLLAIPISFCANGGWTLPFFFVHAANPVPTFYPPIEDLESYRAFADPAHAIVLSAYFIHFEWDAAWQGGVITFGLWYAAMLALLAATVYSVRGGLAACGGALAFLAAGLVLSMGLNGVPRDALVWFYLHVPFAELEREPVKFGAYVAAGMAIGVAVAWDLARAGIERRAVRGATLVALVILAAVPLRGVLFTSAGYGLQRLPDERAWDAIVQTMTTRDPAHLGRVAFFPPWLTEQSQRAGLAATANPLVFQELVPVADAKPVNTATASDRLWWRAFTELYDGLDPHLRTLETTGVRYLVFNRDAELSPGGRFTPFVNGSAELLAKIESDTRFAKIYDDGTYALFERRDWHGPVESLAGPVVVGLIPERWRTAVPPEIAGPEFDVPPGENDFDAPHLGIGHDEIERCVAGDTHALRWNGYASVSHSGDASDAWIAGDYRDREGGLEAFLHALDFDLPYAYTESNAILWSKFVAGTGGQLWVKAGATATGDAIARIDGGAPVILHLATGRMAWQQLGVVDAGAHEVAISGSKSGTAVGEFAVTRGTCSSPTGIGLDDRVASSGGRDFLIPTDHPAVLEIDDRSGANLVTDFGHVSAPALERSIRIQKASSDRIAIDRIPLQRGEASIASIGSHRVDILRETGASVDGAWDLIRESTRRRLDFSRGRLISIPPASPLKLASVVTLPSSWTYAVIHLPFGPAVPPVTLSVSVNGANPVRRFLRRGSDLEAVIGPMNGGTITIGIDALRSIPFAIGAPVLNELRVANSTSIDIDGSAVETNATTTSPDRAVAVRSFALGADGSLLPASPDVLAPYVPLDPAYAYALRFAVGCPDRDARLDVHEYASGPENLQESTIADIDTRRQTSVDVPVERWQFAQLAAFSTVSDLAGCAPKTVALVREDLGSLARGVSVPQGVAARRHPVDATVAATSFDAPAERGTHGDRTILDRMTFDPGWIVDRGAARHWVVDTAFDGWTGVRGGDGEYAPQHAYLACAAFGALASVALIAATLVLAFRGRKRST